MDVFRELYITGPASNITKLIEDIERSLGNGWTRDREKEQYASRHGSTEMYCFGCDKRDQRQAATLWIAHKNEETWYVSNVVPSHVGQLSWTAYNLIIEDFATTYAMPIGARHNVTVQLTAPVKAVSDWLTPPAEEALKQFSRAANKSTGSSHPLDEQRWCRFIVLAHDDDVPLDGGTLQRWLVAEEGWPEDIAFELSDEYQRGRTLLAYNEKRPWE